MDTQFGLESLNLLKLITSTNVILRIYSYSTRHGTTQIHSCLFLNVTVPSYNKIDFQHTIRVLRKMQHAARELETEIIYMISRQFIGHFCNSTIRAQLVHWYKFSYGWV